MTNPRPIIAVDAMGGDHGIAVTVAGALEAAREKNLVLKLVGRGSVVEEELAKHDTSGVELEVVHAGQVAEMGEKPSEILRRKKDASIMVACQLVKEGRAHGVVSAGHSGATLAGGMFVLGRIHGVERPALATIMVTEKSRMVLIDVGANVDCKPFHLFQFGLMADVLAKDVLGIKHPRVGLLSIGEEEGKGNVQVKEAFELLKMGSFNFVGNVEGRDIFTGDVDVVVCDGFVGNVALKLSEGLAGSMLRMLNTEFQRDIDSNNVDKSAQTTLKRFSRIVDYAEYGGAPLLGLQNIVIVCHGSSNSRAIYSAVKMAATFIEKKSNEHLIEELSANEELTRFGKAVRY